MGRALRYQRRKSISTKRLKKESKRRITNRRLILGRRKLHKERRIRYLMT